jgi:hypothetical protein
MTQLLLNRPPPYTQETLTSWLWRLALANHLPSPALLLLHLRQAVSSQTPTVRHILLNLRETALFGALGELTSTSAPTIYTHTLHRFAHALTLPDQPDEWLQLTADETVRLLQPRMNCDGYTPHFAWCPTCLAEARYVRLYWHVPFVACCTVHRCWLRDACPRCQGKLTEQDILNGCCGHCGFCLDTASAIPVPEDDLLFRLQTTLMSWLYQTPPPDLGLPDAPVHVLLRILHGLRYAAQRAGNAWVFHHIPPNIPRPDLDILTHRKLTLYERGSLYSTAFRGLVDWPHGFHAFLDAYRQRPAPRERTGLRREFGTLYISWINRFWKSPLLEFVQTAFNDYLLAHISANCIVYSTRSRDYPQLLDQLDYVDLHHTVRYLHSSPYSVYRLMEEGHLPRCTFENDAFSVWFKRQDVEALRRQWERYVPFLDVVQQLGISKRLTRQLITAQLLRAVPDDAGINRRWLFIYEDSLPALLQSLKPCTTIQAQPPPEHVLLRDVCIRHGGSVSLNLVQLLQRVQAGQLAAYHADETLLPLGEMWFRVEDIDTLSEAVKTERNWLSKSDVCTYLNVRWQRLKHLLVSGILSPKQGSGNKQFFDRTEVQVIRERLIFSDEISRLLNVPYVSIFRLVQCEMLHPLPYPASQGRRYYIFDRAEFNVWHQKYVLWPEMKRLTTDEDALCLCLKAQHIEPVVNAPRVYLRKEVMNSIERLHICTD